MLEEQFRDLVSIRERVKHRVMIIFNVAFVKILPAFFYVPPFLTEVLLISDIESVECVKASVDRKVRLGAEPQVPLPE